MYFRTIAIVSHHINQGQLSLNHNGNVYDKRPNVTVLRNLLHLLFSFSVSSRGLSCSSSSSSPLFFINLETISACYGDNNYLLDPHGAIGFQSLKEQLRPEERGIFLETAHPIKFQDVLQKAIGELPDFDSIDSSLKEKQSNFISMEASFDDFKALLLA